MYTKGTEARSDPPVLHGFDPEVYLHFKSQGKGHITRMQNVLKAYVKAKGPRQGR